MLEIILILAYLAVVTLVEAYISVWVLALVGVEISFKVIFAIIFLINLFVKRK